MNNKKQKQYELILKKIKLLITCNNKLPFKANTITIGFEVSLINSVKKIFPTLKLVGCLFLYKNTIHRKLASLGLYKKELSEISDEVLKECGTFPFICNKKFVLIEDKISTIAKKKNIKNL